MELHNMLQSENIKSRIDYHLLDPYLTEKETMLKCEAAFTLANISVFVKPCYVKRVASMKKPSGVAVGTRVGCPDGANITPVKVAEAKRVLTEGASILSLPVNIGYVREAEFGRLLQDLHTVCGIAHMNGANVEALVPFEFLEMGQVQEAGKIAVKAGVNGLAFQSGCIENSQNRDQLRLLAKGWPKNIWIKVILERSSYSEIKFLLDAGYHRVGLSSVEQLSK